MWRRRPFVGGPPEPESRETRAVDEQNDVKRKDNLRKPRTIFCREGWYYLGLLILFFLGAVLREINLMLLLAALLCGPLVFNWRMVVVAMRKLEVRRNMPRAIGADDPWVVQVEITNQRHRVPCWSVVVEQTVRRLNGSNGGNGSAKKSPIHRPAVYFPYIPTRGTRSRTFQGRLPQRGKYEVGPLTIATRFPFGLFRRELIVGKPETLTVYPHIGRLSPSWTTRQHDAMDTSQRRQPRQSRVTGELYGVRQWKSGDSKRWIHWRSSARHGDLVVRQFEQPRNRDAAVILDLWQPGKASMREKEHVELAISLAATIVHEIYRRGGSNLVVGMSGEEATIEAGPVSAPLVERIMSALAVIEATQDDHLPEMLSEAMRTVEGGAEIIVVSTRPVEMNDRGRFKRLYDDPALRAWVRKVRVLDTSEKSIEEVYQP